MIGVIDIPNRSRVWLKLETLQPLASVHIRGIWLQCHNAVKYNGARHLVTSGDGNIGLAVASAARSMYVGATIFLAEKIAPSSIAQIEANGAVVVKSEGDGWEGAERRARNYTEGKAAVYIHPYDHPDIWQGHASMVDEIVKDLRNTNLEPPTAIITTVGPGGGVLAGVIEGLRQKKLEHVPVVAVETHGSSSLQRSLSAGRVTPVECVDTIATGLRTRTIIQKAFESCQQHPVIPLSVTDAMAADGCVKFADDHRMLVDATCGATLSLLYTGALREIFPDLRPESNLVVIVCGGCDTSLEQLEEYKRLYSDPPIIIKSGASMYMRLTDITETEAIGAIELNNDYDNGNADDNDNDDDDDDDDTVVDTDYTLQVNRQTRIRHKPSRLNTYPMGVAIRSNSPGSFMI
ncbi:tryptophan synthase beta subunit-like PLP-dependent enzyme [Syncephalis plumigaleata]|nr:tryptophan synthase beta subunit-like PLP-dependent enzyme [Syncephalis plumigaleata]